MSGLIKSIMEFEVKMDGSINSDILVKLGFLECQYHSFVRCELRKTQNPDGWLIECKWLDKESMYDHFHSSQLQSLIQMLMFRSSKIRFESTADFL